MNEEILRKKVMEFADSHGISQKQMAEWLGTSQPNISAMLNGKRPIKKLCAILEEKYGLDEGYFDDIAKKNCSEKPHYLSFAKAGLQTEEVGVDYELQPEISQIPKYDYTLSVNGDSMEPEFRSGDIIACLDVTKASFIQSGRAHILNTSQGVILKKAYDIGDFIKCVSLNPDYEPFVVPKNEIYSIGLVVGMLRTI